MDMEGPKVSVVVTTYNHRDYISECLEGILMQQTTFPFEIILGEDASTDGTREVCKAYAEKYSDIIRLFLRSRGDVIYIEGHPTGRSNFMESLKVSKGKYIALCEGDDYWTDPLKLQKQVDFLEAHPDYALCFHRAQLLNEKGEFTLHAIPEDFEENTFVYKDLLSHYNFIATASVLFKIPQSFSFPKLVFLSRGGLAL